MIAIRQVTRLVTGLQHTLRIWRHGSRRESEVEVQVRKVRPSGMIGNDERKRDGRKKRKYANDAAWRFVIAFDAIEDFTERQKRKFLSVVTLVHIVHD